MTGVQTCALRSEEHTSELQSHDNLVCRLLLEKNTQSAKRCQRSVCRPPAPTPPGVRVRGRPLPRGSVCAPSRGTHRGSPRFLFFFFKTGPPPKSPPFPPPPPFPT